MVVGGHRTDVPGKWPVGNKQNFCDFQTTSFWGVVYIKLPVIMRPRSDKYTFININTSIVGGTRLTLYTKTTVKHEYTQRKQIKIFTIIMKKWRLKSDAQGTRGGILVVQQRKIQPL